MKKNYEVWPAGKLPKEWQRVELQQLRDRGYHYEDPREIVEIFEDKIAKYAGSKYAVAVDSCTDAVFLALTYVNLYTTDLSKNKKIQIPKRCYMSIPMAIHHAMPDREIEFYNNEWKGAYQIYPYGVIDSAGRFTKNMFKDYIIDSSYSRYYCLSFQIKKRIPIGKGGMILTNDKDAYEWFKLARFEGRHEDQNQWDDEYEIFGWNMYMVPEDSARGILLFDEITKNQEDFIDMYDYTHYPDLSTKKIFQPVFLEDTDKYVYESPDGGETVYRRKFGQYDSRERIK